ncbi:Tat pathway signal protein [Brevundimonas sp.]|uniref:Tat pathway signal protein n=1 Tax=Brevundimonas sp. TaxID=1871086 RepID=UPI002D2BB8F3|nr:Tat pathway signal protein [Brevundimonas sp.]HYC66969.1 Tat pathway signal protein [Brevundimonas sp.]
MANTPAHTDPTPSDHQQMDRSNDPEVTRAMDEAAPELAMTSRRQRLTGSAVGVGSVGFDEAGAFDVGDPHADPRENPEAD